MVATTLETALAYIRAGLSVVPIARDGSKRPIVRWKVYQQRLPTEVEVLDWFRGDCPPGIAIVCGAISGDLELLDFDQDADELFPRWCALVSEEAPGLIARLSVVRTPRTEGGYHVRYRCPDVPIPGNTDLAIDPKRAGKEQTLIQTRGQGGYALAPGCPPACHETGRTYKHLSGPLLTDVPSISGEERDLLIRCARYFDRRVQNEPAGLKPGEDFDRRGPDWPAILEPHGWRCMGQNGEERRWRRPGKEKGWSATTGHCHGVKDRADLLRVFSSNAAPFEAGKAYGKFRAWAMLNHGGDWSAAARELAAQGFGGQTTRRQTTTKAQSNDQTFAQGDSLPPVEPWDEPIPLAEDAWPVKPFPLEILPPSIASFFRLAALSLNCPVDYTACLGLGVVAGATGALYAVDIKEGYTEPVSLYLCVVAPKGSGKTPALKVMARPLYEEASRRQYEGDEHPAYVSDITVEKVADLHRENPRGVLVVRDELSGWIHSMDQYKAKGSGSDRQFWLSVNSADPVSVHRKDPDSPPVFVRHPCVTVVGGIQPPVLTRLKGDDDGFFDRILFCFPEPLPARGETWCAVPSAGAQAWKETLSLLHQTPMTSGPHGPRPYFLKLSAGARKAWEDWTNWSAARRNDSEFPDWLKGPLVKLTGFAARLAGAVHVLREQQFAVDAVLEAEDMTGGAALARYFLSHAHKVYQIMGRDPRVAEAKHILSWLRRWKKPLFNRRDLWRALRRRFARPEDLQGPLRLLQSHGYIRWVDPVAAGLARNHTTLYSVSPLLPPEEEEQEELD